MDDRAALLRRTADLAIEYLAGVDRRHVGGTSELEALRSSLGGALPDGPQDPGAVIEALAANADPGLVASAGPRYFGFVVGGSVPAALAADWLTSAWDQNAGLFAISPAAAVVEEVVAGWLLDLFGLPTGCSVGFVTGATMATFSGLAAGRHAVLAKAGWNIEQDGDDGAPAIAVVTGDEAHVTVFAALQMLGLGRARVHRVAVDGQGRMLPDALRKTLARLEGPILVAAQAGNVNTGAFDPIAEIVPLVREQPNAWLHVDGAFGLWAAAAPSLRGLVAGVEGADSWTTDAHKWLNVPYDSGIVICRDPEAHHAAMTLGASYYVETAGAERDPYNWVPESSRRARAFPIYAALQSLGRSGLAELLDRNCSLARRMAARLAAAEHVEILNDVVLNQVLVRFTPPAAGPAAGADREVEAGLAVGADPEAKAGLAAGADPEAKAGLAAGADPEAAADAFTRRVIAAIQADGTCWAGATTWHGRTAMRISVSNWSTTEADADLSVDAMLRCARAAGERAAAESVDPDLGPAAG